MKAKHLYLIILAFVLLFAGCSKNNAKNTSSEQKGRYIEKGVALPEGISQDQSLTLTKKDGMPFLFVMKEKPSSIKAYQLRKDGNWTDATPKWLKTLDLPKGWSYKCSFLMDGKGYQYLFYYELVGDSLKAHLLRSIDGTTYEILHPEGWEDKQSGSYVMPEKVAILEDGSLVTVFYNGDVIVYDNKNFKIQSDISGEGYSDLLLTAMGKSFVLSKADENSKLKEVDIYHTATPDQPESFPYSVSISSDNYCDIVGNDLYLCNADGIHKLQSKTSLWNTMVDGTLTSLSMPSMYLSGFVASSDHFYILYNTDAGYKLMKYSYDATVNTLPSKQLSIYALKDNTTLRQAVVMFQQVHPDVKIDFSVAMTEKEYKSGDASLKEDYIRALNTKLLAGDNYDILVLDGLPMDSFIGKGILTDLSDILKPMLDSKELPMNILDDYNIDGKIYSVPARFSLNLLFGKDTGTKSLTTLDDLAEYASVHKDAVLFDTLTLDEFIDAFAPYLENRIRNTDGSMNREGLIAVLRSLKLIADRGGIVKGYPMNTPHGNTPWGLEKDFSTCLDSCSGFLDGITSFGMAARVKGVYVPFENSYTPSTELGITSGSKQKELSKKFLQLVLSEKLQKYDLYDGFPVNTKALLTCARADRSNYSFTFATQDENGSSDPIHLTAQTKEQIDDILKFASTVTNKADCDEHIVDVLKQNTLSYFTGTKTPEGTADAIIEALNIYLQE